MSTPETVKFYLTDQNTDPILGVLVRVFDETGTTLITQDTTVDVGGDAVAEVTLDGDDPPISYTIRMSKTGVAFDGDLGDDQKSPQLIDVWSPAGNSPTGTNDFDVRGKIFERPAAIDPRLCRASGFFKDASGRSLPNLDVVLINQFKPAIVDGYAVMGERLDLRTDKNGYLQVDLYRNGIYKAWINSVQAAENDPTGAIAFMRDVHVPNLSSFNIVSLLYPVVSSTVFTPTSVSVAVGDEEELTVVVTASDNRVLTDTAYEDVIYASDDPSIATVVALAEKIVVTGVAAGTTQLTAVRRDQTIVSIPDTPIAGQPLTITVT